MIQNIIELNEALLIGKGHHKATYLFPGKLNLCIKIPFDASDYDLKRELRYRRIRKFRNVPSSTLTEYFGTVHTNLGTGYVFEKIVNYDGSPSISLANFLKNKTIGYEKEESFISELLKQLHKDEIQEEIGAMKKSL